MSKRFGVFVNLLIQFWNIILKIWIKVQGIFWQPPWKYSLKISCFQKVEYPTFPALHKKKESRKGKFFVLLEKCLIHCTIPITHFPGKLLICIVLNLVKDEEDCYSHTIKCVCLCVCCDCLSVCLAVFIEICNKTMLSKIEKHCQHKLWNCICYETTSSFRGYVTKLFQSKEKLQHNNLFLNIYLKINAWKSLLCLKI